MDMKVKVEVREMDLFQAVIRLIRDVIDDTRINKSVGMEYEAKIEEIIKRDWCTSGEAEAPHLEK